MLFFLDKLIPPFLERLLLLFLDQLIIPFLDKFHYFSISLLTIQINSIQFKFIYFCSRYIYYLLTFFFK